MRKLFFFVFFVGISGFCIAQQQIKQYEYWFDDNYAGKASLAITPESLFNLVTSIPTDGLSVGLHTFHIHFRDYSGAWSSATNQFFIKTPGLFANRQITGYEYWFDNDNAHATNQTVTANNNLSLITSINANALPSGLHTFHIRFHENSGVWSSAVNQFFIKTPGLFANRQITGYEYWFDNDNAHATNQTVTANNNLSLITSINANALPSGLHTFHIRFHENSGVWSSAVNQFFIKTPGLFANRQITGYEYWFDNDNAHATNQTVTANNTISLIASINANALPAGLHTFHIRFHENSGVWSSTVNQFFIKTPGLFANRQITGYEYWFDNDNAHATNQTVTANDTISLITSINANALPAGLHTFHIRFHENSGVWSSAVNQFFIKTPGLFANRQITGYEYWFDNDNAHAINQTVTANDSLSLIASINANALPAGLHTFHIRFHENSGVWSSTVNQFFIKPTVNIAGNKITAYRYWFDENIGSLQTINLPQPINPCHLLTAIPATNLMEGEHVINIQFADSLHMFSSIVSDTFMVIHCQPPDSAGAITGPSTVYKGQNGVIYTVSSIAKATGYVWTLPEGATIVSGANTNSITVNFSSMASSGNISVYGTNDCGNGTGSLIMITVITQHFAFEGGNPADPVWTIYLSQATLDDMDLQPLDEIAIFDGTTMVGAYRLTEVLTPGNVTDNYITAFKTLTNGPGYTPGHNYSFKCWDADTQMEHDYANVSLLNPWGDAFTGNVFPENDGEYSIADIDFLTAVTHSYNLNIGYQFISSYVTPPNADMTVVLADLLNSNLSFVRSSTGNMLRKVGSSWINNIGNWVITEGYLVKMNAPDDFSITGTPVDPLTPINLNTGYQFISYFHDYPMDASAAFAGILNNNLSFIRNSGGNMLRKLGPNWVNNIGNVVPGEGYLVKMNAPATLIYPAGTKSESIKNKVAIQHFSFEGGNAADPVYTIYISDATINGYNLQAGDEIGVFDGQTLVGSLVLTQAPTPENQTENAIPVFATLNSGEGFTANHPVTFKLWSQGQEYDGVNVTLSNPYGDAYTGNVFPNSDGVYSIASLTATLTGINSLDRTEVAVYPNPSNGTFTLELKSVQSQNFDVTVYNPLGVTVYQQLNVAANGKYSTEIRSDDLPEGIYTLTVNGKDTNYIKKIVIRR